MKVRGFFVFLILCMTLGCSKKCGRIAYRSLPKSGSYYGGTYEYYPWTYYGSDETYHYIVYCYNRGRFVRSKEFHVLKSQVRLNDVDLLPRSEDAICALIPFVNDQKEIISFDRDPSAKKTPDTVKPPRKPRLFAGGRFFKMKGTKKV